MNYQQLEVLSNSLNVRPEVLKVWYPYFKNYLAKNGINTLPRLLAFLAQTAQESGNFLYTEEIGNSNCPGYEGGCKYKGRGLIQLTHLGNYKKFKDRYGVDAVNRPELVGGKTSLVSTPEQLKNSLLASTMYWENANLNALADKLDLSKTVYEEPNASVFKCIGRKINRGSGTDCKTPAYGESVRLDNFEKLRLAYTQNKSMFKNVGNNLSLPLAIGITAVVGLVFIGLFSYDKYSQ